MTYCILLSKRPVSFSIFQTNASQRFLEQPETQMNFLIYLLVKMNENFPGVSANNKFIKQKTQIMLFKTNRIIWVESFPVDFRSYSFYCCSICHSNGYSNIMKSEKIPWLSHPIAVDLSILPCQLLAYHHPDKPVPAPHQLFDLINSPEPVPSIF